MLKPCLQITLFVLCCSQAVHAQVFEDITLASGVDGAASSTDGSGCTVVDFDQDGWDDIVLANTDGVSRFFKNNGDLTFTEYDSGIDLSSAKMISFADYDGDGDLDIFTSAYNGPNRLFERTADGTYSDVSETAGIVQQDDPSTGVTWGDVNGDGFLDLYVCNYSGASVLETTNQFYLNNGDGTFEEMGASTGLDDDVRASLQATFYDYDLDGDMDLFVANDRLTDPNSLYQNNGDLNFSNVNFAKNMGDYIFSMCSTIGDYDNDGDPDVYVTNGSDGNLLKNWVGFTYSDMSVTTGLAVNEYCWGSSFLDFDNDGRKDMVVNTTPNLSNNSYGHNHLYRNVNDGFFEQQLDEYQEDIESESFGLATGDFDQDGRMDYVNNSFAPVGTGVWRNVEDAGNWTAIHLNGTTPNTFGIGAQIEVWAGDLYQVQWVTCGGSYLSQHSYRQHFGLHEETTIDQIKITWLSGSIDVYSDLSINDSYTFNEGEGAIPVVSSVGEPAICPGDSLLLTCDISEGCTWSTGQTGQGIYVSEAGDYTASVVNGLGQTQTSDAITVVVLPTGDWNVGVLPPLCYPDSLGELIISGADSLEIELLHPLDPEALLPGITTWEVLDVSGCPNSGEVEISAPFEIVSESTITPPSCFGLNDGNIVTTASGGSGALTLSYDCDPDGCYGGPCLLTIVDETGCEVQEELFVDEPELLEITLDSAGISDDGTGSLAAIVTGGTEPYTFDWSTGDSEEETAVLEPGPVSLTVTDSNGCEAEAEVLITDINQPHDVAWKFWPNPVTSDLMIDAASNTVIQMIDAQGRVVLEQGVTPGIHRISMHDLPPGIYILRAPESGITHTITKTVY